VPSTATLRSARELPAHKSCPADRTGSGRAQPFGEDKEIFLGCYEGRRVAVAGRVVSYCSLYMCASRRAVARRGVYCALICGHAWLRGASSGDGTMDMKRCMIIIHSVAVRTRGMAEVTALMQIDLLVIFVGARAAAGACVCSHNTIQWCKMSR